MKQLLYVLFAIFLYVQIGGLWGIANQIERDIDYFIDCYYLIVDYFFIEGFLKACRIK